MDPRRVARAYRYAYIASNRPDRRDGLQQRIERVDMAGGASVAHDFGPHGYVGEPVFIPARPDGDEDDGTVVTVVYDASEHRSHVVGLDARTEAR